VTKRNIFQIANIFLGSDEYWSHNKNLRTIEWEMVGSFGCIILPIICILYANCPIYPANNQLIAPQGNSKETT
jgi:hypothetical protein